MIIKRKPWTPDTCPLQAGSVIHNTNTNTDYVVLARHLDYTEDSKADAEVPLIAICHYTDTANAVHVHWLTGNGLNGMQWEYYPNWPDTSITKPCYQEVTDSGISDIEFTQAIFDIAKKLPGVNVLYEPDEHGTYIWDNDAHAIIQGSAVSIMEGLRKCVEEKNG